MICSDDFNCNAVSTTVVHLSTADIAGSSHRSAHEAALGPAGLDVMQYRFFEIDPSLPTTLRMHASFFTLGDEPSHTQQSLAVAN
jgi:hypothetical protein